MIKNKAAKALIIGACLIGSTMTGVYADTSTTEVKPAIVNQVNDESQIYTIQIESVKEETPQTKKQLEIDRYVFADNVDEIAAKGITVTHTGIVGDFVEVGITPYSEESANYLYEIFGKDIVKVVEGQQAATLDMMTIAAETGAQDKAAQVTAVKEEAPLFIKIINNIVAWFNSIF